METAWLSIDTELSQIDPTFLYQVNLTWIFKSIFYNVSTFKYSELYGPKAISVCDVV